MSEFVEFPKIARLSRDMVVTEKIDGTNASVIIDHADLIADWSGSASTPWLARVGEFGIAAGSRTRYVTPHADNFGWAAWVLAHADELVAGLGAGRHFGEWWGSGIQRGYGLTNGEKRFSLFNVAKWTEARPACCGVVPVLYQGEFSTEVVATHIERLRALGSVAAPGFMKPEGVVVFHTAGSVMFKKTVEKDEKPKGQAW